MERPRSSKVSVVLTGLGARTQFTVSENVAVFCIVLAFVFEVPVTVTVVVTGGGVFVVVVGDPPPHPVNMPSPITLTASRRSSCTLRRFFQPRKQNATASVAPGRNGLELRRTAAVVADVLIVSVVVEAPLPEGVTVAGEKLHDAPVGSPEQVNETAEVKPFCGVTEIVTLPLCPPVTASDDGEAAMVKFGDPGGTMV